VTGPRHAAGDAPRRRLIDHPRLVRRLPELLAVAVFATCFMRYRQRWFMPGFPTYVLDVHNSVVAGTAIAPNQYRPLMPWVARVLVEISPMTLPQALLAVDALLLIAAVLAVRSLLKDLGAEHLLLAAAAGFAFWFTKLDHWSPETMLLIALVAVVAREFQRHEPRWLAVAGAGLLMLGARTDFAATLGLTLLVVARVRRSWSVAALGGGLIAGAGVATELWKWLYPQAHYIVDVVQLPFNLSPGSWVFVLGYYGTVLACPALLAARTRGLPPLWPAITWFLAEFGAVFVVGRVEESRIFLPFAAVLAAAAALAYVELRRIEDEVRTADFRRPNR
jgi:hypothetical protein